MPKSGDKGKKNPPADPKNGKPKKPGTPGKPQKGKPPAAVWIWTLSLLPRKYATNPCLLKAWRLAAAIAKSRVGQRAFARVNKPGVAFTKAEVDKTKLHPEIVIETRTDSIADAVVAEYKGDKGYRYRKDRIHFNRKRVDQILKQCGTGKERDAVIFLASTLLHETAHWKDDVIKHPDGPGDTRGEEGEKLEDDIFGGDVDLDRDGNLTLNGRRVTGATKATWSDPTKWRA